MIIIKISAIKYRNIIACLRVNGRDYTIDREYAGNANHDNVERTFIARWEDNARSLTLKILDERASPQPARFRISTETSKNDPGHVIATIRAIDHTDHQAIVSGMHLGQFYGRTADEAIARARAALTDQGLVKSACRVETAR